MLVNKIFEAGGRGYGVWGHFYFPFVMRTVYIPFLSICIELFVLYFFYPGIYEADKIFDLGERGGVWIVLLF